MSLYVDGVLAGTSSRNVSVLAFVPAIIQALSACACTLDEVRVLTVARTLSEIQSDALTAHQ